VSHRGFWAPEDSIETMGVPAIGNQLGDRYVPPLIHLETRMFERSIAFRLDACCKRETIRVWSRLTGLGYVRGRQRNCCAAFP
jgi:hypothetical protein